MICLRQLLDGNENSFNKQIGSILKCLSYLSKTASNMLNALEKFLTKYGFNFKVFSVLNNRNTS